MHIFHFPKQILRYEFTFSLIVNRVSSNHLLTNKAPTLKLSFSNVTDWHELLTPRFWGDITLTKWTKEKSHIFHYSDV